jgi:cell division septum initiation protein DivIVA
MPDENSAATEHSIIQEVTAPLSTLPDNPVPAVADVEFPIVLRGYDRLAVDAYVKQTTQLVAELQATRSPESAVRRALERVGEEVSGILQRAHDASAQITAQSRSEAEDRLQVARQEATQITADARHRLKELDVETDRIWAERQRIVDDAQDLARQLLALAESAAARFPAAEEPGAEQSGEPLAKAGVGGATESDEEPELPVFGGEPHESGDRGEGDEPRPNDPERTPPHPDDAERTPPHLDDAERTPPHLEREHPTEPFDDEVTVIMPPVRPDEDQRPDG